jgi:hypothetical protein
MFAVLDTVAHVCPSVPGMAVVGLVMSTDFVSQAPDMSPQLHVRTPELIVQPDGDAALGSAPDAEAMPQFRPDGLVGRGSVTMTLMAGH